jgi:IclR family acetate operon transcriptional repressor
VAGNSTEPGQSVTSKVSAILLTFTDCDVRSLTEIARLAGLPVSTAHRLAVELASWNLLERDDDGHYRVGSPLRGIGTTEWGVPTLVERASCVLDDLSGAIHRPVRLGVLSGSEVKYVEKRSHHPVTSFDVAATLPAHATALGKVLLAFSPARITDGLLAKGLTQFTRYTIVAPDKFRHNLSTIRQARVAVSSGELEVGNHCVAMPVFADGKVLAAIEVQVTEPQNDLARVSPALAVACGGLSRELSGATKGRRPVGQLRADQPPEPSGVNRTHTLDPIAMRGTGGNTSQPRSAASM